MIDKARDSQMPPRPRPREGRRFAWQLGITLCLGLVIFSAANLVLGLLQSTEIDGGRGAVVVYAGLVLIFGGVFAALTGLVGYFPARMIWIFVTGRLRGIRFGELGAALIAVPPVAILLSLLATVMVAVWGSAVSGETGSIIRQLVVTAPALSALAAKLTIPFMIGGWISALLLYRSNRDATSVD